MNLSPTPQAAEDNDLDFLIDDEPVVEKPMRKPFKVLIADDEAEMHTTTKMVLKGFRFEGRGLEFIDAYTGSEAMTKLREHPDCALIMLDVVMEESNSGLVVVDYIRNTLKNKRIRIILRTGQPGEAPEERVISDYDINDYRLKTELTVQRLYTSLYEALRSYRDIMALEHNRIGLEKIISVSSELFLQGSITDFYNCILEQMMFFQDDDTTLYFREKGDKNGFIFSDDSCFGVVIAATGRFKSYIGKSVQEVDELNQIYEKAQSVQGLPGDNVVPMNQGFLVYKTVRGNAKSFIFIEGNELHYDLNLIRTFLSHYSMALDNYLMNQEIIRAQGEIISALGDLIEKRSGGSSSHVNRVSEISVLLAGQLGIPPEEQSVLKIASILHDVGKAGIPESLLLKSEKLSTEEFRFMQQHAEIGSALFNRSKLQVLKWATTICRHHHERFDGTGYPEGLSGESIPLAARIVALADVLDSLTHENPYREPWRIEDALAHVEKNRNTHFDPQLVDALAACRNDVVAILRS